LLFPVPCFSPSSPLLCSSSPLSSSSP
jgi:hypothetical protein